MRYSGDIELYPLEAAFTPPWITPQPALRPQRLTDGHTEIYSVDTVSQKDEEDETEYPYVAYSHFRHEGGVLQHEKE